KARRPKVGEEADLRPRKDLERHRGLNRARVHDATEDGPGQAAFGCAGGPVTSTCSRDHIASASGSSTSSRSTKVCRSSSKNAANLGGCCPKALGFCGRSQGRSTIPGFGGRSNTPDCLATRPGTWNDRPGSRPEQESSMGQHDAVVVMEDGTRYPGWLDRQAGSESNVAVLAEQPSEGHAAFCAAVQARIDGLGAVRAPRRAVLVA